jgi:glutathione S-transferase
MQLYYSPNACSLAIHILLREAGLPVELVRVDLASHRTEHGQDFYTLNPMGQVPLLQLDDGRTLGEGAVIARYLAQLAPDTGLMPAPDSEAYWKVAQWQHFVATELHKGFTPLFNPQLSAEAKAVLRPGLAAKFALLDKVLAAQRWLGGQQFSVADAYLFTVTRWAGFVGLSLDELAGVQRFMQDAATRPAVQAALAAEGTA